MIFSTIYFYSNTGLKREESLILPESVVEAEYWVRETPFKSITGEKASVTTPATPKKTRIALSKFLPGWS